MKKPERDNAEWQEYDVRSKESLVKLKRLTKDGISQVENVRKASEKRLSKESKLKLDQTNNEDLIQEFDRIASLSSGEEPFDQLNTLKVFCQESMSELNNVIDELQRMAIGSQNELEISSFTNCEEVAILTKRMNQHTSLLKKKIDVEKESISTALATDQSSLFLGNINKVEDHCKLLQNQKDQHLEEFLMANDKCQKITENILYSNFEERQIMKNELEPEIDNLANEVESLKGKCSLNAQKLNYLCKFLKAKEKEGKILTADNSKRIARLSSKRSQYQREYEMLTKDSVKRELELAKEVESLRISLAMAEDRYWSLCQDKSGKFYDLWSLLDGEANRKRNEVQLIHRSIREKLLEANQPIEPLQLNLPKLEKFGEDVIADINQYWNNFSETIAVQVTPLWEIVEIAMEKFIRLKEDQLRFQPELDKLLHENKKINRALLAKSANF
ncbi:dynein regulatory complex protein 1-like [Artemia franciscana]|uniref:dynein regulatory complex protein 1-like n=1 Tax=Artemia franciscana TaxID=6661 RepID=UPI0032D9FD4F